MREDVALGRGQEGCGHVGVDRAGEALRGGGALGEGASDLLGAGVAMRALGLSGDKEDVDLRLKLLDKYTPTIIAHSTVARLRYLVNQDEGPSVGSKEMGDVADVTSPSRGTPSGKMTEKGPVTDAFPMREE
uniref:hypothetical protein n=1 Tax=Thioclava electrotropha TaxID=1549850 RepID=UPI0023A897ED